MIIEKLDIVWCLFLGYCIFLEVAIKELKINYKIFGGGKPFLVLHGWGSSSERWQKVAELIAEKGYLVIVPDLPGFGKSNEPPVAWSLDNYVEWLSEFTEKIPELQNGFYLAGHSFGGALVAKFSLKYNQKVEKLFLISAACVRKNTFVKKFFYRLSKIAKVFYFLPYYEEFRKAVYKFIIRKSDYLNQNGVMKETYIKGLLDDLSYKISFIKTPTVIIWGDKDDLTPLEQGEFISNKISSSKLVIIGGADHSLHIKIPEVLAEEIIKNL